MESSQISKTIKNILLGGSTGLFMSAVVYAGYEEYKGVECLINGCYEPKTYETQNYKLTLHPNTALFDENSQNIGICSMPNWYAFTFNDFQEKRIYQGIIRRDSTHRAEHEQTQMPIISLEKILDVDTTTPNVVYEKARNCEELRKNQKSSFKNAKYQNDFLEEENQFVIRTINQFLKKY